MDDIAKRFREALNKEKEVTNPWEKYKQLEERKEIVTECSYKMIFDPTEEQRKELEAIEIELNKLEKNPIVQEKLKERERKREEAIELYKQRMKEINKQIVKCAEKSTNLADIAKCLGKKFENK